MPLVLATWMTASASPVAAEAGAVNLPDLGPFCSAEGCCLGESCSDATAKDTAKALKVAVEKAPLFDALAEMSPQLQRVATTKGSAFAGLEKTLMKRMELLASNEVDASIKSGALEEVPGIVARRSEVGSLSLGWTTGALARLAKAADSSGKVKAAKIRIADANAPMPIPDDLASLRAIDARWRAIVSSEAGRELASRSVKIVTLLERTTATVDAAWAPLRRAT